MKSDVGDPAKRPQFRGPIQPWSTRSHAARSADPSAFQARKNARRDSGRQSKVVSADSHVCHLDLLADRHRRNECTETQSPAPKYVNWPINSHGGQPPDMIAFEIAWTVVIGAISICELDIGAMKPLLDPALPFGNGVEKVCGA